MKIVDILNGKNILIWGYGREGKATENFIKKYCDNVSYKVYEGDQKEIVEANYDFIIKSPGIPFLTDDPKYISETSLFLDEFKDQIVAITGTKGKSTTSSLLYQVLKDANKKCVLVGNIGNPCFDYYDEIDKDTIIVFEISAHQLALVKKSPHIGVFLNLYEEHLDYYETMDNYYNAKANITKYQDKNDYLLIGENVPQIKTIANTVIIKNDKHFNLQIKGEHNQYNANFVYYIATVLFKIEQDVVVKSMENFKNLKHRIDFVGKIDDIYYYDDSISTIPQATICAIESISNVDTVLIGGMDRGVNYDVLIDFIRNHKYNYIFMYGSGKRMFDQLDGLEYCYYSKDLEDAVALAKKITKKDGACILSPAAASYDFFRNFEERGDMFIKYVNNK